MKSTRQASWALGSEKITEGGGRTGRATGRATGGVVLLLRGAGDGQFLRGQEMRGHGDDPNLSGAVRDFFGGWGERGDPIQRVLRVRVGRGAADACAGPPVCENLRGATRGDGRIGACNNTGAYVRGFSLASPKRRDPRRPGFVLRSADKKHAQRDRVDGRAGHGM